MSAGIGNLRVIAFSGTIKEQPWVHMEILEGSYGGRHGLDGMDAVDTLYANTRNNPIEDIESHLPLRVNRYELRDNVVVPGEWRGGIGSVRVFTYLADGGFSVEGDGQKYRPWGFDGGTDGHPGELIMETDDRQAPRAPVQSPLPEGGARRPPARLRPERRRLRQSVPPRSGGRPRQRARRLPVAGDRPRALPRGVANGAVDVAATERLRTARRVS